MSTTRQSSAFAGASAPHALVVGGSSGIGFATAAAFLDAGMRVTIASRSNDRLASALDRLPEAAPVRSLQMADVPDSGTPIDHFVATAGGPIVSGSLAEVGMEGVRTFFESKALAQLDALHMVLGRLADEASITLVSGAAGRGAVPGLVAVAATNGAVEAAGRSLALELAPRRVNVVSPGFIETEAYDGMTENERGSMLASAADGVPLKRVGQPQDVSALIVAIATNPNVTGTVLDVDGGAGVA